MRIKSVLLSLTVILSLNAGAAHASLITNGNFEQTSAGTNKKINGKNVESDRTTLNGWTSAEKYTNPKTGEVKYLNNGGYNFVLDGNIANTNKSALWLEGNGNGYTASPTGGNFFASDSQYYPGRLSQLVNNLIAGTEYVLTFDYALAQQVGFVGANLDNFWSVGFGGATLETTKLSILDNGFSGWQKATMTFTANGTSELLSFLAMGTAPGAPPFMLLDNIYLESAVPEPATWTLLLAGFGLLGFAAHRRRNSQA